MSLIIDVMNWQEMQLNYCNKYYNCVTSFKNIELFCHLIYNKFEY